jgi:hypothetical protein
MELGDHKVAEQLRSLGISKQAFITKSYLMRSGILPAGEPVGPADEPHVGYAGEEKEYGRLTVRYDEEHDPMVVYGA